MVTLVRVSSLAMRVSPFERRIRKRTCRRRAGRLRYPAIIPMKIFYGWRVVASGGGIQFLQAGLLHQAFGAYFAGLTEEFGWSKPSLSGAAALQPMEAAVLGPVLGWIIDRFGPQGMIQIGIVAFGIGFMLLSQVQSLPGFYGAFLVIAL